MRHHIDLNSMIVPLDQYIAQASHQLAEAEWGEDEQEADRMRACVSQAKLLLECGDFYWIAF